MNIKNINLSWSEGTRAVLCMLPTLAAVGFGYTSVVPALGQAGFFYSTLPLAQRMPARFFMGGLLATFGLGFYLLGGNVVFNPWIALFFTFFIAMICVYLTSWRVTGMLAFAFFTIYSAGLNASSPEKVHQSFMAFFLAMVWSCGISLLPIWKSSEPLPQKQYSDAEYIQTGFRMGIGTAVAFFISQMAGFAKMGWAPSAVGNVVRFDVAISKMRAAGRLIGTIVGVLLSALLMFITQDITYLLIGSVFFAFLNGLFKDTKAGKMPLFYTATILTLYSLYDITGAPELLAQRVIYNIVGVVIGVAVVLYPFPRLFARFKPQASQQDVQT